MNLPLTSVTGLAFKSGHTGRSENGASLFHTWWSISIISSNAHLYIRSYVCATCGACCGFAAMGQAPYPRIRKNRHTAGY